MFDVNPNTNRHEFTSPRLITREDLPVAVACGPVAHRHIASSPTYPASRARRSSALPPRWQITAGGSSFELPEAMIM